MRPHRYPIAPGGIFDTVQGEGLLSGMPMLFLRLAGCSVGCDGCDTDYRASERLTAAEIIERLQRLPRRGWVWLTGGEPTDHPLRKLVTSLRAEGYLVALATAGVRIASRGDDWEIAVRTALDGVNFLSVSPHNAARWELRRGSQLNLVPGLGGLDLAALDGADFSGFPELGRFVTPPEYRGRAERVAECRAWADRNGFRLGVQAHKTWGLK